MDDQLFNTEEKRNEAISQLRRLYDSEDWKLMAAVLDANIRVLEQRIIAGGETKEETDLLRERLKAYKDVRNTPSKLLGDLTSEQPETPVDDVYLKPEELT